MAKGRFWSQMDDHESYMIAKSKVVKMVDEALADFPEEPGFFDKLAAGKDIFLVYAGKVEAWKEKWFRV